MNWLTKCRPFGISETGAFGIMAKKTKDNLHINFQEVDGYQKPFNYIISEREPGKSTELSTKLEALYKKGMTGLVLRRLTADITESYITSIPEAIQDFVDYKIEITFSKSQLKEGVVDVYRVERYETEEGKIKKELRLWYRVISLSNPLSRIKSLVLRELGGIFFDEFICNTRLGEKYLPDEAFKFKELFTTYRRWKSDKIKMLRCYFCGNPYSKYNPYFADHNVNYNAIKRGSFYVGSNFVIWCYEMLPELREKILRDNPLYEFDNAYKKYAFDGIAVNDSNILVCDKQPQNYFLRLMFYKDGKYYGVYESLDMADGFKYWVGSADVFEGKRRNIVAFDFNDLIDKTALISKLDKVSFQKFKLAIGRREVQYSSIESAYVCEEIYTSL